MDSTKQCAVEGCEKPKRSRGFCTNHYDRMRHHGDPLAGGRARIYSREGPCRVDGCEKPREALGLCSAHYQMQRLHGDPLGGVGTKGPKGEGSINDDGYRRIQIDGQMHFEHRLVMERAIGHPLPPGSVVHHRNGDKLDNRIENLELMTHGEHNRLHNPPADFCKNGHPMTPENARIRTNGRRRCRICEQEWIRRRRTAGT